MDYEKAYKEALKKAKQFKSPYCQAAVEQIFPELKESEDEKIREGLINMLSQDYELHKKAIAWLEKQGEQKPVISDDALREGIAHFGITQYQIDNWLKKYVDVENRGEHKSTNNVEPIFKVGDWIIKNDDSSVNIDYSCCKITKVENGNYTIESIYGYKGYNTFETFEKDYHPWTIQDAKDGDILMANAPFIFNGNLEGGIGCPGAHCAINTLGKFQIPNYPEHWTGHTTTPATKEQRDLLFQKMHEAGYKWDAEKKELRNIESNPAWSEEDEKIYQSILDDTVQENQLDGNQWVWLKSIKDRVQPQPKQEWSKEDDYVYNEILKRVEKKTLYEHDLEYIYNWLKSIKHNHWKPSEQNLKDLEWCADLVKDKMGVGFHRLQVFIDELKNL